MPPSDSAPVRRRLGLLALSGAAALSALLAGCTTSAVTSSTPAASTAAATRVATAASGLQTPWSIAFTPAGTPLISERDTGRIVQLDPDGTTRTVTDLRQAVHIGEGGLMGLAVRGGMLYAALTTSTDNRVVRMPISQQGGTITAGEAETIIDGLPSASYHNGGRIAFGPDGMLYVTAGDAGRANDAQDPAALGGKILRLEPDGSVPTDNPFPGSPVYSLGHRNPQGLTWGPDGTLYAAEFGQNTWDELNVIRPGQNYGWPTVEGIANDDRYVDPEQQWSPETASPSGITVQGDHIVIANLRGQRLRDVPLDDLTIAVDRLQGDYGRLRDVAVGPDGDLWVITSNTDGRGSPGSGDDRVLRIGATA